jgi:hypothetical protein
LRVPLTDTLLEEAERFALRSSCRHCLYFLEDGERCLHEWPNDDQKRWPLDAADGSGQRPTFMSLCKEFELK